MEKEIDNKINFLDITILKETQYFSFTIYRNPTTTDTIILNVSCHPQEHKHAAIRYLAQNEYIQLKRCQQRKRQQ